MIYRLTRQYRAAIAQVTAQHEGQACFVPHSGQNFAPGANFAPQLEQNCPASASLKPQEGQNLAFEESGAWQFGQEA